MRSCTKCGKCCLQYHGGLGTASDEDLARWQDRPDILAYVQAFIPDLWVSPVTGEETTRCPWLRKVARQEKYNCRIHDRRPDVCRGYPYGVEQMIRDGCEMLEAGDAARPVADLEAELARLRG